MISFYFAYGANMDPDRLIRRSLAGPPCGFANLLPEKIGKGHIKNCKLGFAGHSKTWGGPTATIVPKFGESLQGVLYATTPEQESALACFENADNHQSSHKTHTHKKVLLRVHCEDGKTYDAYSFVSDEEETLRQPTAKYVHAIQKGYNKMIESALVRNYVSQVLTEITKLPKEYFTQIDAAIKNSSFWTKPNHHDDIESGTKGSMQTPAAEALETALQDVMDDLGLDMDVFVSSFDSGDEDYYLSPGHPAYPNRWLIDASWYVSKQRPGRNTIDMQIMPYGDDADPKDVSASGVVNHIAQTVRHELVHYTQMKKQAASKKLSDTDAFEEMLNDPRQIPDEETGTVQDYLRSHIEIDAHAHDAAEDLLASYGREKSMQMLRGKIDPKTPGLPNALAHYFEVLPAGDKTLEKLKSKIYSYIEYMDS